MCIGMFPKDKDAVDFGIFVWIVFVRITLCMNLSFCPDVVHISKAALQLLRVLFSLGYLSP